MPLGSALYDAGLKSHQGLAKFKDVDALAKSYVGLESEIGALRRDRTGVSPLSAESTPDQIAAYRAAFGIPEKADGYEAGEPDYPEEATPTAERMASFREMAHRLHYTPEQFRQTLAWHAQETSEQWNAINEAREAQHEATKDHLIKKYGGEADRYAQLAHDFVKREYGDEGLEQLNFKPGDMSALGSSPVVLDLLIRLAQAKGHHVFHGGAPGGGIMTKDVALQKIAELRILDREKKISKDEYARQFTDLAKIAWDNS